MPWQTLTVRVGLPIFHRLSYGWFVRERRKRGAQPLKATSKSSFEEGKHPVHQFSWNRRGRFTAEGNHIVTGTPIVSLGVQNTVRS